MSLTWICILCYELKLTLFESIMNLKNNNIIIYQQDSRFIVKLFALNRRQARHTKCHSIHHSQDAIDVREQQAAGKREARHQEVSRCIQSSAMQPGMIWAECQFLVISSTHARGIHGMGVRYPVLQLNEGSDPPQLLCFFMFFLCFFFMFFYVFL